MKMQFGREIICLYEWLFFCLDFVYLFDDFFGWLNSCDRNSLVASLMSLFSFCCGPGPNNAEGSVGPALFGSSSGTTSGWGFPATTAGLGCLAGGSGVGSFTGSVTFSGISKVLISSTVSGDSNCFSLSSSLALSFGIWIGATGFNGTLDGPFGRWSSLGGVAAGTSSFGEVAWTPFVGQDEDQRCAGQVTRFLCARKFYVHKKEGKANDKNRKTI